MLTSLSVMENMIMRLMNMETKEYFLSLADLETLENGETVEMITKEGDLVILSLAKDEEEE